ncbi:molybdopterin cofactor-binding domain-containing protein [Variovorax sp. J22R115]|uniref:xanthine dehydrogenase family protein molybdopterin-binding subunit n=1 Tax=Variovorax sp. J22R115 TaxID=3053509 RepID=UPI00257522F4|nr:molybdopterin cofactor-binding domain-containing protein [Variovorax sp. J22R115]MDM0052004.1 molybdopterin-dependent oxidoreductase [Variovorax sp. J22R115]
MTTHQLEEASAGKLTRRALLEAGALVVGFSLFPDKSALAQAAGPSAAAQRPLALDQVDSFLAVRGDGSVIVYSGKVDLGTGHRIAMRQMVGEELGVPVERIDLIEGDTALTPNQGPTAGSSGVMRGGVELRQAAATAREALVAMAAQRLQVPADQLKLADGAVRAPDGRSVAVPVLVGGRSFDVKMNPKAPLKRPADYVLVGRPLPRPDVPDKVTGRHVYVHDLVVPGMLHGRVVRPPSVGSRVLAVDESSVARLPGVRVVRMADFVGVVSPDEWAAVRAARELKVQWSDSAQLIGHEALADWARGGPFVAEEVITAKGDAQRVAALRDASDVLRATYSWPIQSHGSIGPSCAVADVRSDGGTVWTASQASHRFLNVFAAMVDLPRDKLRVIYLDGAGCYGMNGHDDAAADAVLLSKAVGKPVRVQWSREDELGWDPKGPPQLLEIKATQMPDGRIDAWETDMWVPRATANLEWIPLLSPLAAGMRQPVGQATGLVSQNGDPPYAANAVKVSAHWLGPAPLRPSNIRAPGKVANCFAVESFVDELAAKAQVDPVAFRLRDMSNPRGAEVIRRMAQMVGWQSRPSPAAAKGTLAVGRGMAYIHYKNNETFVAMAMEVEVDRATGEIAVRRVCCAHDCGLMINPDAVRAQVEGNILQTLSRTLYEETTFDRSRVTSVDWASYPLLRFPAVPRLEIALIDRRDEPPLGAGEAASSPVPAALANAVFDATGVRLRSVPFTSSKLKALMA